MTKHKVLFRNFSALGFVQIANYILPLFVVPIISRILGPEKLGLIAYLASYMTYFTLLINFGFDLTATRRLIKDPNNIQLRNRIFSEIFFAKLFLLMISFFIFCFFLTNIPFLYQNKLLASYAFLVCFGSVFSNNWIFQVMQDLPKVAFFDFLGKTIVNVLILLTIKTQADYYWYVILTSLIIIFIAIINFITAINKYKIKISFIKLNEILTLLNNEKTYFFTVIIITLYTTTNTIILGNLTDPISIGYFIAGQKFVLITYSVINIPLGTALFPLIGEAFAVQKSKGINLVQRIIPLVFYLTFFIGLVLFFCGPNLLIWFYGEKFRPSIGVFKILTFIPLIIALANLCGSQIMLNLKMDKIYFKITLIGAIFSLISNYYFINKLGFIGSAWVWLLTEILILLIHLLYLSSLNIYPINLKYFLPNFIIKELKRLKFLTY